MIVTNFKIAVGYTKDNKDLGQALLDALTILRADGTRRRCLRSTASTTRSRSRPRS